jgi:hypothetical protein
MNRAVLPAAVLLALAACSSSRPASTLTTSPPPSSSAAPTAVITTFVVPSSVQCRGATSTVVPIRYAVTGSARRELDVDGLAGPELAAAQGSVRVPVHCDALAHTAALVAVDAQGARTTKARSFSTVTGAP